MKKLLALVMLAALCGCSSNISTASRMKFGQQGGVEMAGPNDPLTGNDWNFGPK